MYVLAYSCLFFEKNDFFSSFFMIYVKLDFSVFNSGLID